MSIILNLLYLKLYSINETRTAYPALDDSTQKPKADEDNYEDKQHASHHGEVPLWENKIKKKTELMMYVAVLNTMKLCGLLISSSSSSS